MKRVMAFFMSLALVMGLFSVSAVEVQAEDIPVEITVMGQDLWAGQTCEVAVSIENKSDAVLDLSQYDFTFRSSYEWTLDPDYAERLNAKIEPDDSIYLYYEVAVPQDATPIVQFGALLQEKEGTGTGLQEVYNAKEFFVFEIVNDVLTYKREELGSKYRLRWDLDEHSNKDYGLVSGGAGNATELPGEDGRYMEFIDPEHPSTAWVGVDNGYTFESIALVPENAGTITRVEYSESLFVIDLNAPATIKVRTATQKNIETTEEGVILDKSGQEEMPSDVKLVVNDKKDTTAEEKMAVSKLGVENAQVKAYDLLLQDALGNDVAFDGTVKVSLPIPKGWDGSATKVYYADSETGTLTDMKGVVNSDGTYISFNAEHFSTYLLVDTSEDVSKETVKPGNNKPEKPEGTENVTDTNKDNVPKTGDTQNISLWIVMVLASLILFVSGIVKKELAR